MLAWYHLTWGVEVGVEVGVWLGVEVGVAVGVKELVEVGVIVGVAVIVGVGVKEAVDVGVDVGVTVGVNVAVQALQIVEVGVGVGEGGLLLEGLVGFELLLGQPAIPRTTVAKKVRKKTGFRNLITASLPGGEVDLGMKKIEKKVYRMQKTAVL